MNNFWQKIQLAALLLIIAPTGAVRGNDSSLSQVSAVESSTQFARVVEDSQGIPRALQLAIVTYVPRHNNNGLRVDLVSAVHVADATYYADLNQRFRDYDALLYELIAPEGTVVAKAAKQRKGFISKTQVAMKSLLDLSFQLDEIDYSRENLIRADLTPTELSQSMSDRGESLYTYFWRIFSTSLMEYAKDPLGLRDWQMLSSMLAGEDDNSLKTMLAYEMTNMDQVRDILGSDSDSAIIGARNERAVQVLRAQIEAGAKRIGIFYGAAHMSDMEARLLGELALTRSEIVWVDAWEL